MRILRTTFLFILAGFGIAYAQSPGIQNTPADGFTSFANGGYVIGELVGRQLITQPSNVTMSAVVPTYGFDYTFTYQGVRQTVQFRYTPPAGDAALPGYTQMLKIMSAFQQQWVGNITIRAAIGGDIVDFAYVRREPGLGKPYQFQFFQSVPFLQSGANPVLTPVAGVAVQQGNDTLEISPFFSFVRSTLAAGRLPQAGDAIGGMYFSADLTTHPSTGAPPRAADSRNVDPIYGSIVVFNADPGYGKARIVFTFDDWVWQDNNGHPWGYTGACGGGPFTVKNGLIVSC